MIRVFLTHNPEDRDAYFGRSLGPLRELGEVVLNPLERDLTTAELIDASAGCHLIVSHRSTPGDAAVFEESPVLLGFLRCAVDTQNIDVAAASTAGVLVAHADKSFVPSTAELALALMLDVSRHVSESTIDYRDGHEPPQRSGRQLRGATAGIIGFGAIGSYLADVLDAIGMRVMVHDPHIAPDLDAPVEWVDRELLLAESDFVVPLAPASPETVDLIDAAALAAMKTGSVLVNVSRGELMDERAVAEALDQGSLGGLAMDVGQAADQRPSPALARRPGVVATPHLGGLTPANADAQAASSVEQVAAIVAGTTPPRSVNLDAAFRLHRFWGEQ
jgi:D-3-phosphoglycerate dehydrogenase